MRDKFFSKTDSKVIHGLIVIIYPMFRIRLLFIRFFKGKSHFNCKTNFQNPDKYGLLCCPFSLFPLVPIFLYVIASKMRQKHPEN